MASLKRKGGPACDNDKESKKRKTTTEEADKELEPTVRTASKQRKHVNNEGYFCLTKKNGSKSRIPNWRKDPSAEVLVYPKESNENTIDAAEWAGVEKPEDWPIGKIWPPKIPWHLTHHVDMKNEWCLVCGMDPKCKHLIGDWRKKITRNWEDRFELRELPGKGVCVFTKVALAKKETIGELAGRLVPSNDKFGALEKSYLASLSIGPLKDEGEQLKATINVWREGS